jgi:multicomponent Na+:H+ antiporter subunit E
MMVLATAVLSFLVWLVVTWTFDAGSIGAGAVVSVALAWAVRHVEMEEMRILLVPRRLFWAFAYVPVLFLYIVRSNLDVAYRVIHPKLPIRPGITKARTTLTSLPARVLLANSITLTPGTMSVDLVDDVLYVHRIYVPEEDPDGATTRELAPFEYFLRRIFE